VSDLGALSHDYELSARMAMDLTEQLLAVRKQPGAVVATTARERLVALLGSIRRQLAHERLAGPSAYVPDEIIRRIEARHSGRIAYVIEDIEAAVSELNSGNRLTEDTLRTLDLVCEAADTSAADMYRRLRRR
jgi:hypothetical protein